MKIEDIDFDDEAQVESLKDVKVEIPVGALHQLLSFYYTGGGEPDRNSDRLKLVLPAIK